jgi:hypothetical protein
MGSVIEYDLKCKKCGGNYYWGDFKTNGEEYIFCERCGWNGYTVYNPEKSKETGKWYYDFEESGGDGCYFFANKQGIGKGGQITDMKTIENQMDNYWVENKGELKELYYTFLKDGVWMMKDFVRNQIVPFKARQELMGEEKNDKEVM